MQAEQFYLVLTWLGGTHPHKPRQCGKYQLKVILKKMCAKFYNNFKTIYFSNKLQALHKSACILQVISIYRVMELSDLVIPAYHLYVMLRYVKLYVIQPTPHPK